MSDEHSRAREESFGRVFAGASRVACSPVDVEAARRAYEQAGFDVTDELVEFLGTYGETTVFWPSHVTGDETSLTVSVEEAAEAFAPNVRYFEKRLGMSALPVGIAFETEEMVLLAENGDIVLGGDAGVQRVAHGFEEAVRALISGDWDMTFF
ncbi:SUKH-3 domain-containing protein [Streptomyces sp. TRM66268-LWL]|uniref:SUKH-3 domain-containing protein n=1 Tax=Streptomyces polyasparticus TaxID=2767826 RepID=A0ABR7SNJ5_9ACTN|nr:SUKH-3 domain-containing protein [Streptomyces polyasparticus]MBC9715873.1 SUKH-3 domain-containing protein [Streptomyces polyasparticus]